MFFNRLGFIIELTASKVCTSSSISSSSLPEDILFEDDEKLLIFLLCPFLLLVLEADIS